MNTTTQVKNVLSGVLAGCKSQELFWQSIAELQGSPPEAAKPKEKRAPSAYVLFSSRVGALIHAAQAEMPKEQKAKQTVIMQFTSPLWEQSKSGKVWEDQEIVEAWRTFVPPEQSKQSLAKAASAAEAAGGGSVPIERVAKSDPAQTESIGDSATENAKKPRKPQSEETKAAAALKRAATKAAKAAAAGGGPEALPVVAGLQGGWVE